MIVTWTGTAYICPGIDGVEPDDSMVLYCHQGMDEMAKTSDAQKKAVAKYNRNKTTQFNMTLNNEHDADILRRLQEVPNKQGYVKDLIRKDIKDIEKQGKE